VHDTPLGRLGGLSCGEHLAPLTRYAMYAQNEQVHVAAWPSFSLYSGRAYALGPEVCVAVSQIYAVEGGCFVLAPCATVSPEMIELLCTDDEKRAMLQPGGGYARIFAPDGQQMHESLAPDVEGIVYADLDLGMIPLAKIVTDPAGHSARPDVAQLLLNRTPGGPVVPFSAPGVEIEAERPAAVAQAPDEE
jgi:nitrilase